MPSRAVATQGDAMAGRFPTRPSTSSLLTFGALVGAIGFNLFLVPSSVAPGGVTGLTLIVTRVLPWQLPNGVLMLAMSIPLLGLGFRALGGPSFLVRTVYVVAVMTLTIDATAPFLPADGVSDDALLNALYGGATLGAANAMIIRAHGNMGGTAILARVLQKGRARRSARSTC